MEKLFTVQIQKQHAELMITLLAQSKTKEAQQLAKDLNERYQWNYRKSAIHSEIK